MNALLAEVKSFQKFLKITNFGLVIRRYRFYILPSGLHHDKQFTQKNISTCHYLAIKNKDLCERLYGIDITDWGTLAVRSGLVIGDHGMSLTYGGSLKEELADYVNFNFNNVRVTLVLQSRQYILFTTSLILKSFHSLANLCLHENGSLLRYCEFLLQFVSSHRT